MQKYLVVAALSLILLSGFSTQTYVQPKEERDAQDALPKSGDPLWKTLGKTTIKINEKKGLFNATYPAEVKQLVGKTVTISGFMLPLDPTEKFKHFILSKRTPTCPFCPPGEPNEILDVMVDKPLAYNEDMITVTGTFGLMQNQEMGLFFKLSQASIQ